MLVDLKGQTSLSQLELQRKTRVTDAGAVHSVGADRPQNPARQISRSH